MVMDQIFADLLSTPLFFQCEVDGPYLVKFFCLLPYTTWNHEVGISVCPQMHLKKPGSIPENYGANLEFL